MKFNKHQKEFLIKKAKEVDEGSSRFDSMSLSDKINHIAKTHVVDALTHLHNLGHLDEEPKPKDASEAFKKTLNTDWNI